MKQFLKKSILFLVLLGVLAEVVIRFFHLVPDIPERYIDKNKIQRYKPGQTGYYTKAKKPWSVNKYGWLGVAESSNEPTLSIIGDSYIENLMNPFECNQANVLKPLLPEYSFFEAGRSGVTFIEAMEISKMLEDEIKPEYQILYLSTNDFTETISEINKYSDRVQFSTKSNKIITSKLKSPGLKKILYNFKLAYYLYLKYPIFINKQNKGIIEIDDKAVSKQRRIQYAQLFNYCAENYNLQNMIFAFHPDIDQEITELTAKHDIKMILLETKDDKKWEIGEHDKHWSCYGHMQVGNQIANYINNNLN